MFAGVGGITHALRGFATPAMYCEIDPHAQAVLRKLMAQGKLPKAPIHSDVTTLSGNSLRGKVDLITAGFPCFVAGTLVNTNNGYVPIENIVGTEMLVSHTGALRKIENLQRTLLPAGNPLYSLKIKHHFRPIVCTEEHPFYVRTRRKVDHKTQFTKPEFLAAKHLTKDHVVGMPIDTRSVVPSFTVKMHGKAHVVTLDSPDQWWVLGYFLGDGWTQDNRKPDGRLQYRICFVAGHKDEAVVVPKLRKALHLTRADVTQGCTKYVACNKAWWTLLQDFGRYAHGKRVPDWVHAAPTHLVKEFVDGYMAADGNRQLCDAGTEHWKMATVSPDVALGMQRLLAKLGHTFGVSKTRRKPTAEICGRTVNQRDIYEIGGRPERLRARYCAFVEDGYVWHSITDVAVTTTDAPQWVYNFQVAEDHSYCVENSATHNCVGMSNSGKREGFANEQSGLYAHVVRLINETRPPFVLLENVAPIVELGMDDVLATLGKAGYNATWVVLYAYHAGAPQLRKRWFCLASRPGGPARTIKSTVKFAFYKWTKEPVARMVKASPPWRRNRLGMMGNSVVPDVVRMAFCWMFSGGTMDIRAAAQASSLTFKLPEATKPFASGAKRVYGVFKGGKTSGIHPPRGLAPRPNLRLVLDPKAVPPPEKTNPLQTTELITRPIEVMTWATPRRGVTHGARLLTRRCKQDLPTQLRFERGTPVGVRMGYVNPAWVEWLMGFDVDWTSIPQNTELPKSMADPDELSENNKSSASVKAPCSSTRHVDSAGGRQTRGPAAPIVKRTRTSKVSSPAGKSPGARTSASRAR